MKAKQPTLEGVEPKPRRRMLKPRKAELYARVEELEREVDQLRGRFVVVSADALPRPPPPPTRIVSEFWGELDPQDPRTPPQRALETYRQWWRRLRLFR